MAQSFAKQFYDSKLWQQQRLHALHRDCYQCQDCGHKADEVHHIRMLDASVMDDYSITLGLDNLVSLCHDCHTKRHKGKTDVPDGMCFDENGQVIQSPPCVNANK